MDWDLLARYITNNATEEEVDRFRKMISESVDDRKQYEAAQKLWEESKHFAFEKDYDVEKEWNITSLKLKKNSAIKKNLMVVFRYAAVILLTISITYLYFNQLPGHNINVAWHEIYVPKGEQSTITLADGSEVVLNSETHFSYPSDFSASNRVAKLNGEAFFDVVKDPEHPFKVESKYQTVKVFGTSFNVKAYSLSESSITTLLHGKVSIYTPEDEEIISLEPNQQAILNHNTRKMTLHQVSNDIDVCWKDGVYYFKDVHFEDLIKHIERWYGVKIIVSNKKLKEVRFSGKFFRDQTVWEVLDLLKLTLPFDYTAGKRTIEITYKKK